MEQRQLRELLERVASRRRRRPGRGGAAPEDGPVHGAGLREGGQPSRHAPGRVRGRVRCGQDTRADGGHRGERSWRGRGACWSPGSRPRRPRGRTCPRKARAPMRSAYQPRPRIGSWAASRADGNGPIVIAAAGTSDLPVAEEAALTAEVLGNDVVRLYDVGVAGIHRLLAHADAIAPQRGGGGGRHGGRARQRGGRSRVVPGHRRAHAAWATAPRSAASRRCWPC